MRLAATPGGLGALLPLRELLPLVGVAPVARLSARAAHHIGHVLEHATLQQPKLAPKALLPVLQDGQLVLRLLEDGSRSCLKSRMEYKESVRTQILQDNKLSQKHRA